jgi:hypothetical protein
MKYEFNLCKIGSDEIIDHIAIGSYRAARQYFKNRHQGKYQIWAFYKNGILTSSNVNFKRKLTLSVKDIMGG